MTQFLLIPIMRGTSIHYGHGKDSTTIMRRDASWILSMFKFSMPIFTHLSFNLILSSFLLALILPIEADETKQIVELTDEELVQEFERIGLKLSGTNHEPTDRLLSCTPVIGGDEVRIFSKIKEEMLARGACMTPHLISFLEGEYPKLRPASKHGIVLSFTRETLELLTKIGDPRAVSVALKILFDGDFKVDLDEQRAALNTVECLTHVLFRQGKPHQSNYRDAIEHPNALNVETFKNYEIPARLYANWLEGEGKDPNKWLNIARTRARELISSDRLEDIYCAGSFLTRTGSRDDQPKATMARLSHLIENMEKTSNPHRYTHNDSPIPGAIGNWLQMLSSYGPLSRPYSKTFLRVAKEQSSNSWSYYKFLREVGGKEILTYLFENLPIISAEVQKIKKQDDYKKGFSSDDPRGDWVCSLREVRFATDRWAGCLFKNDKDRMAWWQANKLQDEQQWLEGNLPRLIIQNDQGELWAKWILREIVPDLPDKPRLKNTASNEKTSYADWFRENRHKLTFHPEKGCFLLK